MVDIKKDFGESFNLIVHRKKMAIPMFFSILFTLILIVLFLNLSGLSPLLRELSSMSNEFEQQKTEYLLNKDNVGQENYTLELISYLSKDSEESKYAEDFSAYLEERNYDWSRYKQLINASNITLLIIFMLIGFLASLYLICMSYAMIALNIKMEEITLSNIMRVTNRFVLKLFSLRILIGFIIIVPIIILAGVSVSLFFLNTILGIMSIVLFLILFLIYSIIVGIRLFFATPAMYMDEEGPVKSIKHSMKLTKGHAKQVILIFFIVYGISVVINNFLGQPVFESFKSIIFDSQWIKVAINLILILFFLLLEAFMLTFENIFIFNTYIDFKELEEVAK